MTDGNILLTTTPQANPEGAVFNPFGNIGVVQVRPEPDSPLPSGIDGSLTLGALLAVVIALILLIRALNR
jgi:hypothetical protein